MKYRKFIGILGLLLVLIACQKEKNVFENSRVIYVKEFPETLTLVGEKLTMAPMGVSGLYVIDTFLLVGNLEQPFFFSVYNLNTQRDIGQWVPRGHGPLEVTMAMFGGQHFYDQGSVKFWFLDINQNKVFELDLTASAAEGKTVLRDVTTFPLRFFKTFHINDTTCFSYQYDTKSISYVLHGLDGSSQTEWTLYKDVDMDAESYFASTDRLKPDGTKLVLGMRFFDQINILDMKGKDNLTITTSEQLYDLDDIKEKRVVPNIIYSCLQCSDDKIFALYMDQSFSDWQRKEKPVEIHVFDWSGQPLYKIDIPQYLSYFSIDFKGKALYGLTYGEEIYRYDLSALD